MKELIPILNGNGDLSRIFERGKLNSGEILGTVKKIIDDVRNRGDKALFEYTTKFDKISLDSESVKATREEIDEAYKAVPQKTLNALRRAKENIFEFHKRQMRKDDIVTAGGKTTGILYRPVERAGLYVPGGKAAYPSSVLMCALPAVVAGVPDIIMTTPAGGGLNPLTLVAANECGVSQI